MIYHFSKFLEWAYFFYFYAFLVWKYNTILNIIRIKIKKNKILKSIQYLIIIKLKYLQTSSFFIVYYTFKSCFWRAKSIFCY